MNFPTPDFSSTDLELKSPGLRSLGKKSSWLKSLGLKSSGLESSWLKSPGLKGLTLGQAIKSNNLGEFHATYEIICSIGYLS